MARIRINHWFILLVLASYVAGCSSQSLNREQVQKSLRAQAEEVGKAMIREDHERMAELVHPTLLNQMGGSANFIKRLNDIAAEVKKAGVHYRDVEFSVEPNAVQVGTEWYAVVPYELKFDGPKLVRGSKPSYLIGVSEDGGHTWKFVDGNGIAENPDMLPAILPNFPGGLRLPPKQEPTFSTE